MEQLPKTFEEAIQRKKAAKVIPFRFWLDHDRGLTRLVYSTDEQTARKLIMQAEGCPDSAIKQRRA